MSDPTPEHEAEFQANKAKTIAELEAEVIVLKNQRDCALQMLADWCVAIDKNGTGWDDWDEYYKDAAYREGPLRSLLDAEIAASAARW